MQYWQDILKEAANGSTLRVKVPPALQRGTTPRGATGGVQGVRTRAALKPTQVLPPSKPAKTGLAKGQVRPPADPGKWKTYGKPLAYTSGGVLAAGSTMAVLGNMLAPGDIEPRDIPPAGPEGSPEISEIATSAAGGAALGGLGSLLYGKLQDKPDLQRDTIVALIGAAAGSAYPFMKNGSMDKEADGGLFSVPALIAASIFLSGALGGGAMYQSHSYQKANEKMMADQQRALESIERAKLHEAAMGRKAVTHGTVGALGGGAIGGTLSNIYGKKTGKESLRRDIMSSLAGAGIGGAAGIYSAMKA